MLTGVVPYVLVAGSNSFNVDADNGVPVLDTSLVKTLWDCGWLNTPDDVSATAVGGAGGVTVGV
jgi:hypothetical protein